MLVAGLFITTPNGNNPHFSGMRVWVPSCCSRVRLFATSWTVARQAPLSIGCPRQEHWNGLPFPTPGDLPDPEIELVSPKSSALAGGFFTTEPPGIYIHIWIVLGTLKYYIDFYYYYYLPQEKRKATRNSRKSTQDSQGLNMKETNGIIF